MDVHRLNPRHLAPAPPSVKFRAADRGADVGSSSPSVSSSGGEQSRGTVVSDLLARLEDVPAVRDGVVAKARTAVSSGRLLTREAAEATAASLLGSP